MLSDLPEAAPFTDARAGIQTHPAGPRGSSLQTLPSPVSASGHLSVWKLNPEGRASPCLTLAGNMCYEQPKFLPLCACPWIPGKRSEYWFWGYNPPCKEVSSQIRNPRIMRINCICLLLSISLLYNVNPMRTGMLGQFCSLLNPQSLGQNVGHSRCSINICWKDQGHREKKCTSICRL